jgi:hypothetical protein
MKTKIEPINAIGHRTGIGFNERLQERLFADAVVAVSSDFGQLQISKSLSEKGISPSVEPAYHESFTKLNSRP